MNSSDEISEQVKLSSALQRRCLSVGLENNVWRVVGRVSDDTKCVGLDDVEFPECCWRSTAVDRGGVFDCWSDVRRVHSQ